MQIEKLVNLDAEQAVIGSLLLLGDGQTETAQRVIRSLKPSAFYSKPHAIIYRAIVELATKQQPIDMISLDARLQADKCDYESVGGFSYLADIQRSTPSAANILAYAKLVRDRAVERHAACKLQEAIAMMHDPSLEVGSKLDGVAQMISDIQKHSESGDKGGLKHIGEVAQEWLDVLDKRFTDPESVRGMTTGIPDLDELLAPKLLQKGTLMAVGARPKMGKSTFLNYLIANMALVEKKPVHFYSLEMPEQSVWENMVSQHARVKTDIFYRGAHEDVSFAKVHASTSQFIDSKLYIDDTPGISMNHVIHHSRSRAQEDGEVGIIAVDYLTLMEAEKAERNDLAYGKITKAMKNLAKELNCVVVMLTQLNRNLEQRIEKRPQPSDSRDTGQIEQDVDYWIGLYRDEIYDQNSPEKGVMEILLRLNRHGKTGDVKVGFHNGQISPLTMQQMSEIEAMRAEEAYQSRKGKPTDF